MCARVRVRVACMRVQREQPTGASVATLRHRIAVCGGGSVPRCFQSLEWRIMCVHARGREGGRKGGVRNKRKRKINRVIFLLSVHFSRHASQSHGIEEMILA